MYAVEAVYDGINFKPKQPISVKGQYEVIITFLKPVTGVITDAKQTEKHPRSAFIGSWKDKIWMSEDFNEPLDEMKEYME
jgi:predicted DNA-binding antitoxin AbrB/MazE fold protein